MLSRFFFFFFNRKRVGFRLRRIGPQFQATRKVVNLFAYRIGANDCNFDRNELSLPPTSILCKHLFEPPPFFNV